MRNNRVTPKLELILFDHTRDAILHTTTAILTTQWARSLNDTTVFVVCIVASIGLSQEN